MWTQTRWWLAGVIFMLLGVTGWLNHGTPAFAARPQDERPPIVIYEGSIHFNFGGGWIQHASNTGWWIANLKSDPQGAGVTGFEAIVTTAKAICQLSGAPLTIDYVDGTQKRQFILAIDQTMAVLKPPVGTQLTAARHWNLRAGKTGAGAITGAAAGGKTCTFQAADNVRIVVKLRP